MLLQLFMGHMAPDGEESLVEAFIRERIEKILQKGLIADLYRPQKEADTGLGGAVCLQVLGILSFFTGKVSLILVDQGKLLRFFDEPGAELWMGNSNQRHGPLADIFTVQVGLAILGNDVLDVAAGQGDPSPLLQQGDNARGGTVPGG